MPSIDPIYSQSEIHPVLHNKLMHNKIKCSSLQFSRVFISMILILKKMKLNCDLRLEYFYMKKACINYRDAWIQLYLCHVNYFYLWIIILGFFTYFERQIFIKFKNSFIDFANNFVLLWQYLHGRKCVSVITLACDYKISHSRNEKEWILLLQSL